MLFKLSIKNMKKSIKDYAIYFLTLVLGVAIFYMFNSLDSQQAMLEVSQSTHEIIQLMISMLEIVSVFVAVVLGLLIVYANNFLINRRKKEFGIYMTVRNGKNTNIKNNTNRDNSNGNNITNHRTNNRNICITIHVNTSSKTIWSKHDRIQICILKSSMYKNMHIFRNNVYISPNI